LKKTKISKSRTSICTTTLSARTHWLIIGLVFSLFACEDPGEIGLNINPENGVFVARYVEIPIESKVVQHRDIISDNTTRIDRTRTKRPVDEVTIEGRFLVGKMTTPETGEMRSTAYTGLYLNSIGFTGVDDANNAYTFDSLKMFARVEYYSGSNLSSSQKIRIHELLDSLIIDSLYLTRSEQAYNAQVLGTFDMDLTSFDSTVVDTVYSVRLADELGQRFMDEVQRDTMAFSSNPEFRKFFYGFAFVPDESNDVIAGIHAESNSTFVRMYFHSALDTTSLDFIFDNGYNEQGDLLNKYFNRITLNKSGTPVDVITDYYREYETNDAYSYIQGSSGILTKLDMSAFFQLQDTVASLVINRAELTVPVKAFQPTLVPSTSLDLYLTDDSNRFISSTDTLTSKLFYQTVGSIGITVENTSDYSYAGNVTSYVQGLADGTIEEDAVLLAQQALWNSVLSVNQSVVEKDRFLLKVYYSALK
jgi:hypothetical protein